MALSQAARPPISPGLRLRTGAVDLTKFVTGNNEAREGADYCSKNAAIGMWLHGRRFQKCNVKLPELHYLKYSVLSRLICASSLFLLHFLN